MFGDVGGDDPAIASVPADPAVKVQDGDVAVDAVEEACHSQGYLAFVSQAWRLAPVGMPAAPSDRLLAERVVVGGGIDKPVAGTYGEGLKQSAVCSGSSTGIGRFPSEQLVQGLVDRIDDLGEMEARLLVPLIERTLRSQYLRGRTKVLEVSAWFKKAFNLPECLDLPQEDAPSRASNAAPLMLGRSPVASRYRPRSLSFLTRASDQSPIKRKACAVYAELTARSRTGHHHQVNVTRSAAFCSTDDVHRRLPFPCLTPYFSILLIGA